MLADTFSYQFNVYRTTLIDGHNTDTNISIARGTAYGKNAHLDPLDNDYDAFYRSPYLIFSGEQRDILIESGRREFGNSFTHRPTVKYLERLMKRFDELSIEHNWINEDPNWFPNGSGFDWKVYYGGYSFDILPSSGCPYALTNHRLSDDRFWRYFYRVSNYVYDKTTAIWGSHIEFLNDAIFALLPMNGEIGGDYKLNYQLRFTNLDDYNNQLLSSRFPMISRTNYDLYDNYEYSSGILGIINVGNGLSIIDPHGALPNAIPDVFWNPDGSGHLLLHQYEPSLEKIRYLTYSGLETQYRMTSRQCGAFNTNITIDSALQGNVDVSDSNFSPLQRLYTRYLGHAIPVSGSSFNYTFPPEYHTTATFAQNNLNPTIYIFNSGIVYNTVPSLFPTKWNTVKKSIDRIKVSTFAIEDLDIPANLNAWIATDTEGNGIPQHNGPSDYYTLTLLTPESGLSDYITEIENDFNNSKWQQINESFTFFNNEHLMSRKGDWLGDYNTIYLEDDSSYSNLELEPFIGNNDRIFVKRRLYKDKFPVNVSTVDTQTYFHWSRLPGGIKDERYEISMNSSFSFLLIPVSLRGLHCTAFSHLGVHHKLNDHYLNSSPQSLRSAMGLKESDLQKLFLSYYLKPQTRMPNLGIYKNYTDTSYYTDRDDPLSFGWTSLFNNTVVFNNLIPIIGAFNGDDNNPYSHSVPIDTISSLYNTFINNVSYADLELVYGYIDVIEEIDRPNFELLNNEEILDYHESFNTRPFIRPSTESSLGQTVFLSGIYISDLIANKLENNDFTNVFDIEISEQETRAFDDHVQIIISGQPLLYHIDPDSQAVDYSFKSNDLKYTSVLKSLDFPYSGWFNTIPPSGTSHMFIAIKPKNMRSSFLASPSYASTVTSVDIKAPLHGIRSLGTTAIIIDDWQIATQSCSCDSNGYGEHVGGAYIKSNTIINSIGIPTFMRSPKSGEIFSTPSAVTRDIYNENPNNSYISNSGLLYDRIAYTDPDVVTPSNTTAFFPFANSDLGPGSKVDHWYRYGACKMLYDMREIDSNTNNLVSIFDKFWVTTHLNMYGLGSGCKRDELHTPAYLSDYNGMTRINGNMASLLFKQNGNRYQPVPVNPYI